MICFHALQNPQLLTLSPCRWRLPITLGQFCGVCLAGEKKSTAEFYSSYKNAGLRRVGFGFPGHPALNYSLKASAQVVEFVWIDGEAERVVAKTLALFVSLQFIQIKRPTSGRCGWSPGCVFPPFILILWRGVSCCFQRLSVCDILKVAFHMCHHGSTLCGRASRGGLNPGSGRSFTAH